MNLRQQFIQHLAQTGDSPLMLEIVRAEGCYIFDKNGKAYLDIIAGVSVSALGHCHPAVVRATKNQLGKYLHASVYGEYILSPQVQLATLIADNLPQPLASVYFVNSGSEATEGAMRLAKRFTGRPEIAACRNAYHGSTQGAASLMSPNIYSQASYPLLPGIRHIDFNKENDLGKITRRTAAVVLETVQGGAGVIKPENGYLKKLRQRCDETGALLILDEIQTGYGRTGTLWAFEQYGIVPDILLLAKGMGGGMPIGAFVSSKEIMSSLTSDPPLGYLTTFGGHPVCCAAALATLQVLLKENFIEKVKEKEALFHQLLKHPAIKEVRTAGLMVAVELENSGVLKKVQKRCLEAGLVTYPFLFNDKSLRMSPPLIISKEEIRKACSIINESLRV
ncbi:MAG TPA: aspartate aminotransferase family protein [Bacteroidetes bacterium]|nr:aspartate aminotransferase family protein [Bacteroidota bacterium]